MTVVVTGASGHVGGNLVRALLEDGRKVRVTVRKDSRAVDGLKVERAEADLTDYKSLSGAFKGAGVVYHCAAIISVSGDKGGLVADINVKGTQNVVNACLKQGVKRLVHFSSVHALSHDSTVSIVDEDCPLACGKNNIAYDRSKAMAEETVQDGIAKGLDAVIVNPTAILGPFDFKPSAMGEALLKLFKKKMPALVDGAFDWVDVRDVANGAMLAEKKGRKGERYLLSGHYCSFPELARIIEKETSIRVPRLIFPLWVAMMGAPFAELYAHICRKQPFFTLESLKILKDCKPVNCTKAEQELGYTRRPLAETIRDTYEWFRASGIIG